MRTKSGAVALLVTWPSGLSLRPAGVGPPRGHPGFWPAPFLAHRGAARWTSGRAEAPPSPGLIGAILEGRGPAPAQSDRALNARSPADLSSTRALAVKATSGRGRRDEGIVTLSRPDGDCSPSR